MVLRIIHIILCTTFFMLPACFEKEAVAPIDDDGDGYSVADGDCSDLNPAWHPAAVDTLGDGIDQNCDLVDGVDEDGDTFASVASGGDDCNDIDETIYASATDTLGDNIDQNCDELDGVDADKDGHASEDSGGDDCNDSNAYIKPGVMDACDAVDRDCDGTAVGAAKVLVNNNVAYETINAAISAAQEGDTLLLCAGTYQGNYAIEKDLTLRSMDGAATTILEGSGSGSVITVYEASLNLYDFTIKNGQGKNQSFTNGTTAHVGGGLSAVNAGKVVVDGCIFEDNEADDGGGIYFNNLSQISTVKDTVVKNNTAERDGGGIYIYKSAIDFRGEITISNNTATGSGGGLLFSDDSAVDWLVKFYDGGTIEGNEAAEGGGVFVEGDDLTLNGGVQIINNVANGTDENEISTDPNPKNGGGIEINQGDFEMSGGLISGNQSAWLGGGIKSYSVNMKLTDVEISDNVVDADNNTYGSGGGIYHLYGVVEITGGSIKNNEAPYQGGGLHFSYADTGSILKNIEVSENSAENGAGLDIWNSTININSLTITNNTASDNGGGLRFWTSTSSVTSTTISNNTATSDNGGGVEVSYGSNVTINTSTISDNTAGNDGAGLEVTGKSAEKSTLSMTDSTISNNTAERDGGGIDINYASEVTLTTCTLTDNSAEIGGGISLSGGTVNEDYDRTSTLSVTDVSWGNATDDNDNSAQELTAQNNTYTAFDWHDLDADESFTCDTSVDPVCTFEE